MEIGNYATLEEVVATAASRLPGTIREDWQIFRTWAFHAMEKIGPFQWTIDTQDVIENNNGSFCKPDKHLSTIDLAFFSGGTEIKYRYHQGKAEVHQADAFGNIEDGTDESGTTQRRSDVIYVYEDDHYIHTNNTEVDCMRIQYYTVPTDGDGNPIIPRYYVDALVTYIQFQWEMSGNNIAKAGMLRNEWKWLAKKARGKNKMPNMKEGTEVIRRWMSMFDGNFNKYRND